MNRKPPRPCTYPGCPEYASKGSRCDSHQPVNWQPDRGTRHERGYGRHWEKVRAGILSRDKHLCQPCYRMGRLTQAAEVDHVTPKSQGGTDGRDNLQAICQACHRVKTAQESRP